MTDETSPVLRVRQRAHAWQRSHGRRARWRVIETLACTHVMLFALCLSTAGAQSSGTAPSAPLRWYKGNTHTHTLNSDGDSSPDDVAHWYREHGYQFLFLTDHNFLTSIEGINALIGADERFLLIPGEE